MGIKWKRDLYNKKFKKRRVEKKITHIRRANKLLDKSRK